MTENEALKSALEKVKAQKVNFGFMERFDVDENWEVMKALEEIQQYRAIGTVEEIQQKLAELDRWHTSEVNQLAEEYKDKEYCWQECASTEHCKECSRLGNGDNDYFESIDDWAESLPTIDAGELLNDGWITDRVPTKEECGYYGKEFLTTIPQSDGYKTIAMRYEYAKVRGKEVSRWTKYGRIAPWEPIAWQPLPEPYQQKG